ncbi:MAG: hypothetical protein AAGL11_10200 [Pseudomonadota bacterium]
MKTLFASAALAAALTMTAMPAQADGNGRKAEKRQNRSPIIGTYISRFTSDVISFPGFPDIPCGLLIGNPDTPFVTNCESALMVTYFRDGIVTQASAPFAVLKEDDNDELGENELTIASSAQGTWTRNTRSTFQNKTVNVIYDSDAAVAGYRVSEATLQANADFSGFTGTFVSTTYAPDVDPLDVNSPFTTRTVGTTEGQRVQ